MAKLHFFYSTMNAGKSTSLLQSNHNYLETNLETMIFLPKEIEATSNGKIVSRIGLEAEAIIFDGEFNFLTYVNNNKTPKLSCILVDESQFLTKVQVQQLGEIADEENYKGSEITSADQSITTIGCEANAAVDSSGCEMKKPTGSKPMANLSGKYATCTNKNETLNF